MVVEIIDRMNLKSKKTKRLVNKGAEKWLGKEIKALDHGFVYLVDYFGSDEAVEQAARVSYGSGTRKSSETRGLLRYLLRNDHTTPFEMAELKFHAKMPIFVARQWVRHRTANINEYSARYSVVKDEFYIPDSKNIATQSTNNKQGRGETLDSKHSSKVKEKMEQHYINSNILYQELLDIEGEFKVARELSRAVLPVSSYTEWYWKIDLHNLLHFLRLRLDAHAQYEIRVYAEAMAKIVKDAFPIVWEAFEDYKLNSLSVTRPEKEIIIKLLKKKKVTFTEKEIIKVAEDLGLINKRETNEMIEKIKKLELLK